MTGMMIGGLRLEPLKENRAKEVTREKCMRKSTSTASKSGDRYKNRSEPISSTSRSGNTSMILDMHGSGNV